ncbi:MAG TPA: DUF6318 family protein [Actinotalea sp.]|nr:DUF6318 family protein [Actinotalea sp.]
MASALVLSGCASGGDPDPSDSPAPSTTASPSPSPSVEPVAAPVRPPEMDRSDEVGAVAAAEYFMELFSYAFRTGDLDSWNRVSAQDCSFCSNVRADVEAVYSTGGRFEGGEFSHGPAVVVAHDPSIGVYTASIEFSVAEFAVRDEAETTVRTIEPEAGTALLDLVFTTGGWSLLGGMPSPQESA